ncbi:B-box zinc finger protein 22-like [Henckelia pumila]|uniref:B-box zinc finger protein 22-like n=1 Tax=Henckelia pumila TaxID=405737 RepID=UPI003C6DF290
MKIQCSVCEAAEANVLCCADDAALCWACDEKVHSANRLVSKHQRVLLSSSQTQMPKCDICQETIGYFFCLEDRALFCRKCDLAIHTVNSFVSKHQRFLLTGVKVGIEAIEHGPLPSFVKTKSQEKVSEPEFSLPKRTMPIQVSAGEDASSSKPPIPGGSATEGISPWHLDDFVGLGDFSQIHNFMDSGSSKVDNGRLGDSDSSPNLKVADGEFEDDEYMRQVPETFWAVPQIPSPPTASGLLCPKTCQDPSDWSVFVPDISLENSYHHHHKSRVARPKRRRHL